MYAGVGESSNALDSGLAVPRGLPVRPVPGGDAEPGDRVDCLTAIRAVEDELPETTF